MSSPILRIAAFAICVACKPSADAPLGPAASFALFAPMPGDGAKDNQVVLVPVDGAKDGAAAVSAALIDGFAAELLRTVFSTKQYIANSKPSARALAWANDATVFVMGMDRPAGPQVGASIKGSWIGGPVVRPQCVWIGLPEQFADSKAAVPIVASRIARYLGVAAATAGEFTNLAPPLADAYAQAMEVVAQEWRPNPTAGAVATTRLTPTAAQLFAGVRENRFVLDAQKRVRPVHEILDDPRVAATIFYRWFQDKQMMKRVASDAFYAPLKDDRVPVGFSLAAVLGPFRNLQMKVIGTWIAAVRAGSPPANIGDLILDYGRQFPLEREAVVRIFLATTFGATVKVGGVSPKPEDGQMAQAELSALSQDVISGKTPLVASP